MSLYTKNTIYNYVNFYNYNFNSLELYRLYMPIISSNSLKLFLHLCSDVSSVSSFKFSKKFLFDLIETLNFTFDDFEDSRKNLEAVGLLRTYSSKNNSELIFDIFSPLNFNSFISNQKLKKLLIKKIGEKEFEFLKVIFSFEQVPNFYNDISTNIDDYYDNYLECKYEFDFNKLYENLSQTTSINILIDDNIKKLINNNYESKKFTFEQIESLIYKAIIKDNSNNSFVVSYDVLVKLFSDNLKENIHNDFKEIVEINRCNDLFLKTCSISSLNKAYKNYSSFNSEQYLFLITNTEINNFEIDIINMLRKDYKLNDMLINMMIDYSLEKTHHTLNEKYLKKIAKSFKLKNITSLDEAYEHLSNWEYSKNKKTKQEHIKKDADSNFSKKICSIDNKEDCKEQKVDYFSNDDSIDWSIFE